MQHESASADPLILRTFPVSARVSGVRHVGTLATTSRLTVEALARRGSSAYVPSAEDLLTRAWPQYRAPIESHWYPYLAGSGTLEEAIDQVVAAVK
ncbi:MAG: hypothetical protein ACYC7A_19530 [Thermoanaerobaculia bacterium]